MLTELELDELMNKINLPQFKNEGEVKTETRGRKPIDLYNHWYYELRSISDYSHLSSWVDDVLTGAGSLDTGNTRVSPQLIFNLIKSLPFISTGEIKQHMNSSRMRVLWGDQVESNSYCSWLRTAVLSAMRSLDFYSDKGMKIKRYDEVSEKDFNFNLREDIDGWEEQKRKCEEFGVDIHSNLENPLRDLPIEERKLLAGLTVEEINGERSPLYSTGEINISLSGFKRGGERDKVHPRYTRKEFEEIRKHSDSYFNAQFKNLPEMIDIDTGEIITYQIKETKK